jgi:hypothetical protein
MKGTMTSRIVRPVLGMLAMSIVVYIGSSIYHHFYGSDLPAYLAGIVYVVLYFCALPHVLLPSIYFAIRGNTAGAGSAVAGGLAGILISLWMFIVNRASMAILGTLLPGNSLAVSAFGWVFIVLLGIVPGFFIMKAACRIAALILPQSDQPDEAAT